MSYLDISKLVSKTLLIFWQLLLYLLTVFSLFFAVVSPFQINATNLLTNEAVLEYNYLITAKRGTEIEKRNAHPLGKALATAAIPTRWAFPHLGDSIADAMVNLAAQRTINTTQGIQDLDGTSDAAFFHVHRAFMNMLHNASQQPLDDNLRPPPSQPQPLSQKNKKLPGKPIMSGPVGGLRWIWEFWGKVMGGIMIMALQEKGLWYSGKIDKQTHERTTNKSNVCL